LATVFFLDYLRGQREIHGSQLKAEPALSSPFAPMYLQSIEQSQGLARSRWVVWWNGLLGVADTDVTLRASGATADSKGRATTYISGEE